MGTSTNILFTKSRPKYQNSGLFQSMTTLPYNLKSHASSCAKAQYDQMTTPNSTFKLQLLNQLHTLTRIYLSCCCLFLTNWLWNYTILKIINKKQAISYETFARIQMKLTTTPASTHFKLWVTGYTLFRMVRSLLGD